MPNINMQSNIYGVSISDSEETIPFYYMPEYSSIQNPTKNADSTPKTKCAIDVSELLNREQDFLQHYYNWKSLAEKLTTADNSETNEKNLVSVKQMFQQWDEEVRLIHTHRRQLHQGNHLKLTPDELLAKIKRQRWCYSCFNTACIQEDGFQGKFFCSVECQLNYYDS